MTNKGPSGGAQGANKYSCSLREMELCSQVIYIIWTCFGHAYNYSLSNFIHVTWIIIMCITFTFIHMLVV